MTITGVITKDKSVYTLVVTQFIKKHNKETTIVSTYVNFKTSDDALKFFNRAHPNGSLKSQ